MGPEDFAEKLNKTMLPQSLCLSLHIFCTFLLVYYVWSFRNNNPVIKNSPLMTIWAQIVLVFASFCLFFGKLALVRKYPGQLENYKGPGQCYGDTDDIILLLLGLVYVFCIQFMYMVYLLKMIRIIKICSKKKLQENSLTVKLFRSQKVLILMSFLWALIIMTVQFGMNLYMTGYFQQAKYIYRYPQFNNFFCDSDMFYGKNDNENFNTFVQWVFNIKLFICLLLFLYAWQRSYKLEDIDNNIRIRLQYFVILMLRYLVMLTDKIQKLADCDDDINTALPSHYVDCMSNLLTGVIFLYIHFAVAQQNHLYLPEAIQLNYQDYTTFFVIYLQEESKQVFKQYLYSKNRIDLYDAACKFCDRKYNFLLMPTQDMQQMQNCLRPSVIQQSIHDLQENQRKNRIRQLFYKELGHHVDHWLSTVSGKCLKKKWKKNSIYCSNMQKLGLVPKQN